MAQTRSNYEKPLEFLINQNTKVAVLSVFCNDYREYSIEKESSNLVNMEDYVQFTDILKTSIQRFHKHLQQNLQKHILLYNMNEKFIESI